MNKNNSSNSKYGMYIHKRTYHIDPEIIADIETCDNNEAATIIHCQYTSPEDWNSFSLVEVTNEPGPVLIHAIERNKSGVYYLIIE